MEFTDAGVKDKILWVDNFTAITTLTVMPNPAATEQPKAGILGCNLFANGSGEDTLHWWHGTQIHVQTDNWILICKSLHWRSYQCH